MPDFGLLAIVMLAGVLAAAAVMLLGSVCAPPAWRHGAGWAWAVAAGIYAACGMAGEWPHWPPLEDRARFLTILVPLALAVESGAAATRSPSVARLLRLCLAASAAPILLYNSVYLADHGGPGTDHWSPAQAVLTFCVLASLLVLVWSGLYLLQSRTSARAIHAVLALDALAAALAVMLSGYYRGGVLGLGVAGAIAGASIGLCCRKFEPAAGASLGISMIGIFTVVLIGRFFGALPTGLAVCLFLAPLLAWTVELPRLRTLPNFWRGGARLFCVAIPLLVIVYIAQARFIEASAARSNVR